MNYKIFFIKIMHLIMQKIKMEEVSTSLEHGKIQFGLQTPD